jgi:hypothetical protein
MTETEQISALLRLAAKRPRISLTAALREIREQEAITNKTMQLRNEVRLELAERRLRAVAGISEGLV